MTQPKLSDAEVVNYSLTAEHDDVEVKGFPPATILEGPDAATGDLRIAVNSPGGESETRLTDADELSLLVEGAEAGEDSEAWAVQTLCARLKQLGLVVALLPGENDRGEDGFLQVGDIKYVLQVTTATPADRFWGAANTSSAKAQATIERALEWLRRAIEKKGQRISSVDRARTVLAIDVRHAGLLAQESVAKLYTSRFGDPARKYGFASVWVVGPTVKYCARFGEGVP